jgi:hypothetical protein
MRARICCAALAIALMPAASSAQDGLRSASLPERSLRAPREDVFLARPGTFRPDRHRDLVPFGFGFLGPQLVYPAIQPIIVVVAREPLESTRVAPPVLPAPVSPPAPYVAGAPGAPKTFYVIPGCYAGDRPPDPETLKPGCSISRLRVVPPRP